MTKQRSCGMNLGHGLSCESDYQCSNCSHIEGLTTVISEGIDCAQRIVDRWESGDLAEAVRILEDWAVQAAEYLPEEPDLDK